MAEIDAALLGHIRDLLEDTGETPVVSDVQIVNLAVTRRRLVYYEPLDTEDYLTWYHSRKYIETTALSRTFEGADIDSDDYEADAVEGSWTFTAAQSAVYLKGFIYDLRDIVAQCWLVKAGLLDAYPGLTYSLGDETVDKSTAKEYCISQHWRYRTSRGGRLRRT